MILRSLIAIITVTFLVACGSSAPPRAMPGVDLHDRVMSAKAVRVGVKADTPPFGYREGDLWFGFDVDLAVQLFQEMGINDVVFVPVTTANRIAVLRAGDVDCLIASMTITRTRERLVDFTIPYFQDGQGLLVKNDSPIQSYVDLAGKRVGVVRESTSAANMVQVAPDARLVSYPDYPALIAGLKDNQVDAITSDSIILLGLARNAGMASQTRLAGPVFSTEPYGIAVPENQSRFRDALNESLQRLWETGRWQQTYDTWFGPRSAYKVDTGFAITPFPK